MSDWQLIATAPRDGTLILVWDGTFDVVYSQQFDFEDGRGHAWFNYGDIYRSPTHWQPLPSPPGTKKEEMTIPTWVDLYTETNADRLAARYALLCAVLILDGKSAKSIAEWRRDAVAILGFDPQKSASPPETKE